MRDTRVDLENSGAALETPAATFRRVETIGDFCVLEVRGDLDIAVSAALGRELDGLLDTGRDRVGIDLSGVMFMDSSALSALIHAHERARAQGHRLELLRPSPACAKILTITGLDRVFDVR
jgi:anti-sigma B factor antagonist